MYRLLFNNQYEKFMPLIFGEIEDVKDDEYNYDLELMKLREQYITPPLYFPHERVGECFKNYNGSHVEMIDYHGTRGGIYSCITTEYPDTIKRFLKKSDGKEFNSHKLKSPFDKSILGVGCLGYGYHTPSNSRKWYDHWHDLMRRCYSEVFQKKQPTYIGCSVDPYFWNFQNFCYWCEQNYYEIPEQIMCLDKDILYKGNKVYGPNTCVFVPNHINNLFTKTNKLRGDLPIGVTKCSNASGYVASMSVKGNKNADKNDSYIGYYNTVEEAFNAYKEAKEKEIKRVADLYKDYIPYILYQAMYNYKVEITD